MFNFKKVIDAFVRSGIDYLIHVPATGMSPVYEFFEKKNACISASREEEGIAIACGISLGGKTPLVFIQQSGVGNMLNAYIGLAEGYKIYFPILVLDRGVEDENPIQAFSSLLTIPVIHTFAPPFHINFSEDNSAAVFAEEVRQQRRWFITKY